MAVTARNVRALNEAETRTFVTGGAVNMGDVVYVDSNGAVQQARANAALTAEAIGVVIAVAQPGATAAATGEAVEVCVFGPVGGFSGLTPGAVEYLSDTTAGALVETAPSGSGKWAKAVGRADAAGILFVLPGVVAARSSGVA
jgi:hypothetical protein